MDVKNYKLPPLPNKKNSPLEYQSEKAMLPGPRITSYSRQKYGRNSIDIRPTSQSKSERRPMSVREKSVESVKSRESVGSRNSRDSVKSKNSNSNQPQLVKRSSAQYNLKMRVSMPTISAKSWGVFQINQSKFIYGKRIFKKREIASLTKMMNFVTILQLLEQYNLDPGKIRIKASRQATLMIGTTAQLRPGIELSLEELFYGMMLPSGNDAAYQIAQIGGSLLQMEKNLGYIDKKTVYSTNEMTLFYISQQSRMKNYLAHMNKVSKRICMKNSNFANPHGLSNPENYSCAEDLGKLCTYAMQNQTFRNVVSTQYYTVKYLKPVVFRNDDEEDENEESEWGLLRWENTNKMLKEGWSGIKTGITPNAGPCLAASVKKFVSGRNLQFLVILIASKSMEARWTQVKQIVEWVISQQIYF